MVDAYSALSELIAHRLLGVRPEDQDLVLEDDDWRLIIDALSHKALIRAEQDGDKVERAARVIAKIEGKDPDALSHNSFHWWRHYAPHARAVIKEIEGGS